MRPSSNSLSFLLGAMLATSTAMASIPAADGTYTGCYLKALGSLRVIDTAVPSQRCVAGLEVQVTWNASGPTGPAGPTGPQGPSGPPGASAPLCHGRPGGTCSASTSLSCAYDQDCPTSETCVWAQPLPRFVDNGNGTVTDRRTCLQWEKKTGTVGQRVDCVVPTDCPDPHDVSNHYSWAAPPIIAQPSPPPFNGTASTMFLAQLNGAAFAGHTDWRLPTSGGLGTTGNDPELESILDPTQCPQPPPPNTVGPACIDPIFGPTYPSIYWSSSSVISRLEYAWFVTFGNPIDVSAGYKGSDLVRAVRGGPGVP